MTMQIPEPIRKVLSIASTIPIFKWVLFRLTIYELYLGVQWRCTRNADKDIKKELLQKDFRNRHYR